MKPTLTRIVLRRKKDCEAAVLATTLILIALMSMLTAATLYRISSRYSSSFQSSSWNEAMGSAEAGADLALVTLNNSLSSPATAWAAWTPSDSSTFPKTYVAPVLTHGGQGNNKLYTKITVDQGVGGGWLRVRSTGVAELPTQARNGVEAAVYDTNGVKKHLSMLRKTNYVTDLTSGLLHLPQVQRTIEVLAAPSGSYPFIRALTVKNTITMSGGAYTDSFDSTNSAYSTNGQYVAAKAQQHGDIATNSSGSLSDLGGDTVKGNASSNGGTLQNTTGVTGTVTNNFQTTLAPVTAPTLSNVQMNPTIIKNGNATLTAGTPANPTSYILSELTLSGGNIVNLVPPAAGQQGAINIYITGNNGLTISGGASIVQQAGVTAKIYTAGPVTISGGGVLNQNNTASTLQVFGINPSSGGTSAITISGSAAFVGVLDAPAYAITISGSGGFMGAAIGLNVTMSGGAAFHYDQALSKLSGNGTPVNYTYAASWVEDIR